MDIIQGLFSDYDVARIQAVPICRSVVPNKWYLVGEIRGHYSVRKDVDARKAQR